MLMRGNDRRCYSRNRILTPDLTPIRTLTSRIGNEMVKGKVDKNEGSCPKHKVGRAVLPPYIRATMYIVQLEKN